MSTTQVNRGGEGPGRILVVDDDRDSRDLLQHLLAREGYIAIAADGGPAALEILREHEIDVILLDVMMPGMDGFAVCRELKRAAHTADLPVILLTALDDLDARLAGMRLGVSEFLTKPVNKAELCLRVKTQVAVRRRGDLLERVQRRAESLAD